MKTKKIVIASDHAGFELKEKVIDYLKGKQFEVEDLGTHSPDSVDYPDFGHALAEHVASKRYDAGISLCGSGNGINITANKHPEIRSALCWRKDIAELARKHNDANICALPARFISFELACQIVDAFLSTSFEGGRHQRRIDKIPVKS
ncbi:MAG: sugar-phosphate isomerase, RpiB/LacA/LacB family [Bacteroidetes bacterium]|jgi:ribose 5-phosphate isomerase B|nr:sugar-phosphate isomerase, RpiB/LacA/LacB family [Bacteroidota bacterium]